jgi:FMN phosphatase YigB (HAD superfamily)
MKTIVLLDVDGTIVPTRHHWTTVRLRGLQEFDLIVPPYAPTTVRVRPAVIEAINSWHAAGVDIRWLSSWGWRAHWLARAIGLPELETFYEPSAGEIALYARSQRPWKRFAVSNAAEDDWEAPVRVVWIDNEPATGPTEYLEQNLASMHENIAEVLLVRPDEERA